MESNQQTRPLLHLNCLIGNLENVQKLIAEGVEVNQPDLNGCSALQLCSAAGHLAVAKFLIQNGARPELQDPSHGNCSLHEVAWRGYSCLVKALCVPETINKQNKGGFSALHLSCQAGHNQSTRELLIAGADPNLVNTYGDSPLHTSVRYGHAGVARILLSARANTDIQNKNGDCAIHIAAAMGRKKLTKILLSAGCRQDLKNHQRETPLSISIRKEFEEITQILKNPPNILTPIQRDELRASKYKVGSSKLVEVKPEQHNNKIRSSKEHHQNRKNLEGVLRSSGDKLKFNAIGTSTGGRRRERDLKETKGTSSSAAALINPGQRSSGRRSLVQNDDNNFKKPQLLRQSQSQPTLNQNGQQQQKRNGQDVNWSPYGCHYYPSTSAFPPPNLDSLPKEPLTTGELYYLDLGGNIHKGPIGSNMGCYCTPLLHPDQDSLECTKTPKTTPNDQDDQTKCVNSCQVQLKTLTSQLSKIHIDTQLQLSSLHTLLNDRLKDSAADDPPLVSALAGNEKSGQNEQKLRDWVKQYRRFRKEIKKDPKALLHHQLANDLLETANNLILTRPPSPHHHHHRHEANMELYSDSDSGL